MNQVILSGVAKDLNYGQSQNGTTYCRFNLMVEDKRAGSVPVGCVVLKECANTLNEAGEGSEVFFIGQVSVRTRTTDQGKVFHDQSVSGFELVVTKRADNQTEQAPVSDEDEISLDSIPF